MLLWPSRAREIEEISKEEKSLKPEVSRDSHQASSFSVLEDQARSYSKLGMGWILTLHIISATSALLFICHSLTQIEATPAEGKRTSERQRVEFGGHSIGFEI